MKKKTVRPEPAYSPGWISAIAQGINNGMKRLLRVSRRSVEDYCPIGSIADSNTLCLQNGALVTLFKINGISQLVGKDESERIHGDLIDLFSSALREEHSAIHIVFQRDKRNTRSHLEKLMMPLRGKAKLLDIDYDMILNERIETMLPHLSGMEAYCAIITYPFGLVSKKSMKEFRAEQAAAMGGDLPDSDPDGIRVYSAPDVFLHHHKSTLLSISSAFDLMGMKIVDMDVYSSIHLYREFLFPEETSDDWRPILPGDTVHPRMAEMDPYSVENLAAYAYPKIGRQLAAGSVSRKGMMDSVVKVGARYVSTSTVNIMPQKPKTFDSLINNIADINIPFRFSIVFYGGADFFYSKSQSKKSMAYFAAFTWPANKRIASAGETLADMVNENGDTLCGVSMSVATWGDTEKSASERSRRLSRAVDAWGEAQSEPEVGDPFLAYTATLPGWADNLRTVAILPVSWMLRSLPLSMVATVWADGSLLFRDRNGGVFPYNPMSNEQQTSNILAFAPPGAGKSALISAMIMGAILDPVIEGFPKIGEIDIGNSTKGVIHLLKAACPKHAENFIHVELELSNKFGINVFETRLGCPLPTTVESGFLKNFVTLVLTSVGEAEPIKGGSALASLLVDEAFRLTTEDAPVTFDETRNREVTEWVHSCRDFVIDKRTTWWQIVDLAMRKKEYHIAFLAQRYAVPTMQMLPAVLSSSTTIKAQYSDSKAQDMLLEARRLLMSFIGDYPSLCQPSTYTFTEADICIIDLNKVTQDTGPSGKRKTTVAYMVSRYLLGKDFLANRDILLEMPPMAQEYYRSKIMRLEMQRKYMFYDEFHRTGGATGIRKTVEDDMRNGRKFNLLVMLASQDFDDFDEQLIKQSTVRFVLRVAKPEDAKSLAEKYGWTESVRQALVREVRGAGEKGATMLMDVSGLKSREGTCTQVLTSIISPTELAAFSTTREDAALRDAVIESGVPYWDTVLLIGKLFPRGVKKQVEDTMKQRRKNSGANEDDDNEALTGALAPFIDQVKEAFMRSKMRGTA